VSADFDIFIIGGGINGCGIARDAAGRGYSVALCEKSDLASGTSSCSTKLIHGGLRYLEHYEFRLVREALSEREILWDMAPHIIRPLRFVLPHHKGLRPKWLLRLGLYIYDYIGGRKRLPATETLDLKSHRYGTPLKKTFETGFEYSDCWVEDSRLVVLNAMDARDKGVQIQTRTKCTHAERKDGLWHIKTEDQNTGEVKSQTARLLINASGPWVDEVLQTPLSDAKAKNVRLVKGSHIVVPKIFDTEQCYIFQNADDRIIFAIPYEQNFTLLGTTDEDFKGDLDQFGISEAETAYICDAASEYFEKPILKNDVVWSYAGVRPLYDDGSSKAQEATRDYVLRNDGDEGTPQLINVFGGKITTYRRLAESMLEKIETALGKQGRKWTAGAHLPGGDFETDKFDALLNELTHKFYFLDKAMLERLVRSYGTKTSLLLQNVSTPSDLGQIFGGNLTAVEVNYLIQYEWAQTAEDVVWRRSKLGLRMTEAEIDTLEVWMKNTLKEAV
jgi:glycerol-3-phosphate dehydrogenase